MKRRASVHVVMACLLFLALGCKDVLPPEDADPTREEVEWKAIATYPGVQLSRVSFDPTGTFGLVSGYASNEARYYRSNDGGKTWIQGDSRLGGMRLMSPTVGYLIYPPLQKTEDGGRTFTTLSLPTAWGEFIPITSAVGFFFGIDTTGIDTTVIWKTVNGGVTWTVLYRGKRESRLSTLDGNRIIILARDATPQFYPKSILTTTDGGTTWSSGKIDTTAFGVSPIEWFLHSLAVSTVDVGVVAASTLKDSADKAMSKRTGVLLRTTDGGQTWKKVYEFFVPWRLGRFSMEFLLVHSPKWLMVVNEDTYRFRYSTYISYDEGNTWGYGQTWDGMDNPFSYHKPTFAPPSYDVGISGPWMTRDGGRTWVQKPWYVQAAAFLNATELIGVRDSLILRGTLRR